MREGHFDRALDVDDARLIAQTGIVLGSVVAIIFAMAAAVMALDGRVETPFVLLAAAGAIVAVAGRMANLDLAARARKDEEAEAARWRRFRTAGLLGLAAYATLYLLVTQGWFPDTVAIILGLAGTYLFWLYVLKGR